VCIRDHTASHYITLHHITVHSYMTSHDIT
jgi:hypothetical protein